jgi:hypothetical protein
MPLVCDYSRDAMILEILEIMDWLGYLPYCSNWGARESS